LNEGRRVFRPLKDASADFEPIGVFTLTLSGPVLALP
jgi:hypothetical protein